jgi:WD40 repeat protein
MMTKHTVVMGAWFGVLATGIAGMQQPLESRQQPPLDYYRRMVQEPYRTFLGPIENALFQNMGQNRNVCGDEHPSWGVPLNELLRLFAVFDRRVKGEPPMESLEKSLEKSADRIRLEYGLEYLFDPFHVSSHLLDKFRPTLMAVCNTFVQPNPSAQREEARQLRLCAESVHPEQVLELLDVACRLGCPKLVLLAICKAIAMHVAGAPKRYLTDNALRDFCNNKAKGLRFSPNPPQLVRQTFNMPPSKSLLLSHNKRWLLMGFKRPMVFEDDKIILYDTQAKTDPQKALNTPLAGVKVATFSYDDRFLATSFGKGVYLWDVQSRECIATFAHKKEMVRVVDTRTNECLFTYLDDVDGIAVSKVVFSPKNDLIAVAFEEVQAGGIYLWDIQTGALLKTLTLTGFRIDCIGFTPEGDRILVVADNMDKPYSVVASWDLKTNKYTEGHHYDSQVIAIDKEGSAATFTRDNTIEVWDANTEKVIKTVINKPFSYYSAYLLTRSFKGKFIAVCYRGRVNDVVAIWDIKAGDVVRLEMPVNYRAESLEFGPDGATILIVNTGGGAVLLDTKTGECITTFGADKGIHRGFFSFDLKTIVTQSKDSITFWPTPRPKCSFLEYLVLRSHQTNPQETQSLPKESWGGEIWGKILSL